ncbi:exonuclease SbcC [Streptosporangium sandarakinum]|uniref:Nuclease SbcCD subunit C n=1 Tax=Streptosporangium sandarakinum TaxID=1260955 RepID=A0A852VC07_9ACTN|nr:AAA family ATPase [Streptosporangium sandarakinum]NYF43675.1 exonuclease SbcC [Streptosporangium sandarakinum]
MRPHRLWISAFGSFPGEEEIDFDALTEAGLFLIQGPTGAGKTTVLDALCYALYGRVPGRRDSAKSLRCDHAPPGRGPSVALEVTVRGRRLRITRSPAWQRPKLRGTGTTRENEKAVLQELLPSGEWLGLTTRVDEAGELIGNLLGMNADQFFQVAMLPQGDFARFLRADGEDRRRVLERLFSVRLYAAAETWLAERRTEAHREQQTMRREVDFAVQRLEEAAGPALLAALAAGSEASGTPGAAGDAANGDATAGHARDTGDAGDTGNTGDTANGDATADAQGAGDAGRTTAVPAPAPDPEDDPRGWAAALETLAAREAARAGLARADSEAAVRRARADLERGMALADRRRRHADALARGHALEETAEERADLEIILAEAARADRVLPLLQAVEQRAEAAGKAHDMAADALARALPLLGVSGDAVNAAITAAGAIAADGADAVDVAIAADVTPDRLAGLEGDRRAEISRLAELRAEEARLARIREERERADAEITALGAAQAETDARLAVLPGLREDAEARLAAVRLDAARVPAAEAVRQTAVARLAAAEHRDRLAAELAEARRDVAARLAALPGALRPAADPAGPREALAARERERGEELAALEGLRADEERLAELEGLLAALDAELADAGAREAALQEAQRDLPAALDDVTAQLTEVRSRAARMPAARAVVDAATARLDAARRRDGLHAELAEARTALAGATDHAQRLRDRHLDLRQARIDGMAAELAAKLLPGEPCAVCGSPDHPAPAAPAAEAPTAEDERAAQGAYDAAAERRRAAEVAVTALDSRLGEALTVAGDLTVAAAEEALGEARRELADLSAAAGTEAALTAEAGRLTAELDDTRRRAAEAARALAEGGARRSGWRAEHDRLTTRLDDARGADPTVQDRRDRLAGEAALLAAALAAAVRAADVEAAHRDACAAADLTVADAVAGLEEAERALARLRESAAAEPAVAGEAGRAAAELEAARERSRELAVTLAARRTHADKLAAEAERLAARLDEARGDDPSLTHRLDRLADEAELLREAAEAAREERVTAAELEAARTRALAAVAEAGFRSADDARSAVRPPAEQEEKAARLRELDEERAAVTAMLADPELVAAAAEPEPDLDGLRRDHDTADEAHAGLRSALHGAEARRERLAVLRAELEGCLDRWLPAAERHRLTERMAALTGGNSTDNRWNMRLSSYVLGERLRQVVAAANERLDHMSGGRYLLEHNLGRSAGDRSRSGGGLGLRILDGWTGVDRDPATLSGGESFITSLALALGLADVVTAEAGGVEIGTLFVDEGFGTLDEDTLDGVLDILDGLRDGGRAVGIVSHVAELRTRVPAQLRVRKERRGSTLSVTGV